MITILKIPLYLEVESGNQDRAKVTKVIQTILIPLIVRNIKAKGLTGSFDRVDAKRIQDQLGEIDVKLLSDIDALGAK